MRHSTVMSKRNTLTGSSSCFFVGKILPRKLARGLFLISVHTISSFYSHAILHLHELLLCALPVRFLPMPNFCQALPTFRSHFHAHFGHNEVKFLSVLSIHTARHFVAVLLQTTVDISPLAHQHTGESLGLTIIQG